MRATPAVLLLCLIAFARAREWKSEIFHCVANVPDSPGWQVIDPPPIPGIAPVLVLRHAGRQVLFGINIIEKYRDTNLADPAVQQELEATLRQLGYQFFGHATVKAGGLDWLQYPVRAGAGPQQVNGLIRYASAGGYVFSITMLRGGGQQAAQDAELQQAAASFHVLPETPIAAVPAVPNATTSPTGSAPPPLAKKSDDSPATDAEEPAASGDESKSRLFWIAGGVLFVLIMFISIIGRGAAKGR